MKLATAQMSLQEAKALYLRAKEAYYNEDKPVMTDAAFDRLEERLKSEAPKWAELKKTGIAVPKIGKKSEALLFVPMSSLDKIKADN